eukprot:TRINITY_DN97707_c0_g1_i1.p1 TRINITY_DN97707_c0_g1~~TRINITY_DN97707_c0_g1_i1.p1  ORF type:complete len:177 (-),score=37.77 TRINITY_DN97707_c0_g1_i1:23-553(-)
MKARIVSLLALALVLSSAGSARAADAKDKAPSPVEVSYVSSEKFTDFKDSDLANDRSREYLEDLFREHLQRAAKPYLATGQKLEVRFTDIDLAGDFEPWRGVNFHDIRIVKDIYPPRMKFDFKLTDVDGKVVAEGKRELSDLSYMMNISIRRDDPYQHDKALLDDWLRKEFKKAKS